MKKKIRPICTKTMSGRHLFMPVEWMDARESRVWEIHGVTKIAKCMACGMFDDEMEENQ